MYSETNTYLKMKTILCIIRASTEQQETESQKKELVDFLIQRGFNESDMLFIEVQGASAAKCNKKYLDFLADIKRAILDNPTIKSAACWHLNRLGRVESKLHEIKDFFVEHKIQLYVKNPAITLLDDNGELNAAAGIAFSVYASMVKFETDEMFAKMKRGRMRNKEQNLFIGGNVKFGYIKTADKHLILNPDEVDVIKLVFELYATGKWSMYALVDELNARGIRKRNLKITFNIVRNIIVDDQFVKGYYGTPGIISQELFDKCTKIRERETATFFTKEHKNINYCVGLIKCNCGSNYIAQADYYYCYRKSTSYRVKENTEKCKSPGIRRDVIDRIVVDLTYYLEMSRQQQDTSQICKELENNIVILKQKAGALTEEVSTIKDRKTKLQDDYYVEGNMTDAQYKQRVSKLDAKIDGIENQIATIRNEIEGINKQLDYLNSSQPLAYNLTNISRTMLEGTYEERKEIKDLIFRNIREIRISGTEIDGHKFRIMNVDTYNGVSFKFGYDVWRNNHMKHAPYLYMFVDKKMLEMYDEHGYITLNVIEVIKRELDL